MNETLGTLNAREAALLKAVADAFFPPGGPIPVSGSEAGIVSYFDRYVGRSGARQGFLMRLLFLFTDLSPIAFGQQRKRFTELSRPARIQHLADAFVSRIYFRRVSFISLRALMTMAYLSNDEVARHLNMQFHPDPFAKQSGPGLASATAASATREVA
jgi:hypothetical protein